MKVKLTYFKRNGKFYTEGEYTTQKEHLFKIWEEVEEMQKNGEDPGMGSGASEFIILVEVPEHPHEHPHLIMPA